MHYAGDVFLVIGALFLFLGSLGVLRMPDVYNRMQAGTKATTLGVLSILIGTAFYQPMWIPKLIVMGLFLVFTAPISSHNLARAAHKIGLKMVLASPKIDHYAEQKGERK